MRMVFLAPRLPPQVDGVGDHAALLGERLSRAHDVWYLTEASPAPNRFHYGDRLDASGTRNILGFLAEKRIQTLLLEYVPFLYGRSGLNPALLTLVQGAREMGTATVLVVHEPFVPMSPHPLRALRSLAQRRQLRALVGACSRVVAVCDAWMGILAPWRQEAGLSPPVRIGVGSNIPRLPLSAHDRPAVRRTLGIPEGIVACAYFGSTHPSHLTAWVGRSMEALWRQGQDLHLVVMGSASDAWAGSDHPRLHRMGILDTAGISRTLQACDLQAAPYLDGISLRRTSALAGIEHHLPVLSTRGCLTDPSLPWAAHLPLVEATDEAGFRERLKVLTLDPAERHRWTAASETFYWAHLDRELLARAYLETLEAAAP